MADARYFYCARCGATMTGTGAYWEYLPVDVACDPVTHAPAHCGQAMIDEAEAATAPPQDWYPALELPFAARRRSEDAQN